MKHSGNAVEARKWRAIAGLSNAEMRVACVRYKRGFEGLFEWSFGIVRWAGETAVSEVRGEWGYIAAQ